MRVGAQTLRRTDAQPGREGVGAPQRELAEIRVRDSVVPRSEVPKWRERFGLVAGITERGGDGNWHVGDELDGHLSGAAVDWDTTRVLGARIGYYVVVARRERGGQTWFVGAITDEEGGTLDVPLSFLTRGRRYDAEIYADGPNAHWLDNPLPVTITRRTVTSATRLRVVLAPGGGQAIRIRPAE